MSQTVNVTTVSSVHSHSGGGGGGSGGGRQQQQVGQQGAVGQQAHGQVAQRQVNANSP